jgi:hypothetical protein
MGIFGTGGDRLEGPGGAMKLPKESGFDTRGGEGAEAGTGMEVGT